MTSPILNRELKRALNNRLLYWVRTGSVLVGVIIGVVLLRGVHLWTSSAAIGRELFQITTWIGFSLSLLAGVLFTSSLLCEERREGSLALLFLTRVKGVDIIFGKLAPIGLLASQIVLGLFPLLALCIPLGGVSLAEFWRAVQLLLVTLFFSLSLGLFVSAFNKQISRATLFTFAALVLSTGIIEVGDWAARNALAPEPVGGVIPGLLPAMTSLMEADFILTPNGFAKSIQFQLLASLLLLLLAGIALKRLSISDAPRKPAAFDSSAIFRSFVLRRAWLRRNPVYWLSCRNPWRWLIIWIFFCFLLLTWIALLQVFNFSRNIQFFAIFGVAPLLHLLLKFAIAAESVERLGSARNGELELLLVTPLNTRKLLEGHFKGLLRQFAWPIATLVLVDLSIAFFYQPPPGQNAKLYALFIYTLSISLLIDTPALILRGLWNGLRSDTAVRALRVTLAEIFLIPIPVFNLALIIPVIFVFFRAEALYLTSPILLWWVVSFLCNFILQRNARYYITTWLRYIASDPATSRARLARFSRRPASLQREIPLHTIPPSFLPSNAR